jgi:hypothetical protein
MTATNSAPVLPENLLDAAASSGARPGAKQVIQALLDAERQTKQQRQQLSPEALLGTWRLRFTAPKKSAYKAGQPEGSGFYMPGLAAATLGFSHGNAADDPLTIQNQLQIGPLKLRFTGPARFLPKKNLLAFDFVRLQVLISSLCLIDVPLRGRSKKSEIFSATPVGKLPFFAFFAACDRYIAARGRGGGLALWVKVEPQG